MTCKRKSVPKEGIFHIINRSVNGMTIFVENSDFEKMLELLLRYRDKYPFDIYHYALMSTHMHLETYINDMSSFSCAMHDLTLAYYHYFRRKYDHKGVMWHRPFKSIYIRDDVYLIRCGRYIELNPVKAGIVDGVSEYKWTSYAHYATDKKDPLITTNPYLVDAMGNGKAERRKNYIKFVAEGISIDWRRELDMFENVTKKGRPRKK